MDYPLGTKNLPKVLQGVVLGYFKFTEVPEAYEWYQSLLNDIKSLGFLRRLYLFWVRYNKSSGKLKRLYLLPEAKLLKYLEILLDDGH